MLTTLEEIFNTSKIETRTHEFEKIHSNTSKEQCLFIQQMFDFVKPKKSLEIGLAYGISALAILEKHKEQKSSSKAHLIIEPFPWEGVAEYNIEKEGLSELVLIEYKKSDEVLADLFYKKYRIQFAYVDTTKVFDIVLQDYYFIDKILDVNGVIILDDCGGQWPGIQRVARFINTLPHYKLLAGHNKSVYSFQKKVAENFVSTIMKFIPFKNKFYPTICFKTDSELGLNYSCLAFQKISEDKRNWDWDRSF